jgi:hypothetical protein
MTLLLFTLSLVVLGFAPFGKWMVANRGDCADGAERAAIRSGSASHAFLQSESSPRPALPNAYSDQISCTVASGKAAELRLQHPLPDLVALLVALFECGAEVDPAVEAAELGVLHVRGQILEGSLARRGG